MRDFSLLAMVASIALTAGLIAVLGETPDNGGLRSIEARLGEPLGDYETTTTAFVLFENIGSDPLPEEEVALTEQAVDMTSTTTTIPEETTTTAEAPATTALAPAAAPQTTTPPSTQPPPTAPSTTVASGGFRGDAEASLHGSINSLRSSNGLGPLSRNGSLDARARDWARTMAEAGKLKHSSLGSLVPPWSAAGENVGVGGSASGVFDALAGSSGHRSNMLGDYTHVGIGVWQDASGTLWVVNVFTR